MVPVVLSLLLFGCVQSFAPPFVTSGWTRSALKRSATLERAKTAVVSLSMNAPNHFSYKNHAILHVFSSLGHGSSHAYRNNAVDSSSVLSMKYTLVLVRHGESTWNNENKVLLFALHVCQSKVHNRKI